MVDISFLKVAAYHVTFLYLLMTTCLSGNGAKTKLGSNCRLYCCMLKVEGVS